MPIYEYRCGACKKKFEKIFLRAEAGASAACPKCGAKGAERLVSRFATAAKGGGDEFGSGFGDDHGDDDDFGGGPGGGWGGDEDMMGTGLGDDGGAEGEDLD